LGKVVAPVAAKVDPRAGDAVDEYVLLALAPIGPDAEQRIVDVMGAARFTIDRRRFSDG
jgi:hypothetical protein